jgi:general nucleoside transport system permease protein
MQTEILSTIFAAPFFAAAVRAAAPIMGAAAGEAVYERAGVVNIGLEGMMLSGAFTGVVGSMLTGSVWGGVLGAVIGGMFVGILHAFVCITFKADQILCGMAVNFGALGATEFFSRTFLGQSPKPVAAFGAVNIPWFSRLPFAGEVFFSHIPLVYVILALCIVTWFFLFKTLPGLRLRAVGENPFAARAAGIGTAHYAFLAAIICGGMAGLAGACYSIGSVQYFSENMTSGNGFIALAVVIMARRNPLYCVGAAFVFSIGMALALRLQGDKGSFVPYEFIMMLPYVLTLAIYAIVSMKGRRMPSKASA